MTGKGWIALLGKTFDKWNEHQAIRISAAVAFYTLLSIAPLLIFITAIVALVFSQQTAQNSLIAEADALVGLRGGDLVRSLVVNTHRHSSGLFPSIIAAVTVLFGAMGVFSGLRDALNTIWEAKAKDRMGWRGMILHRLFSFGMMLSIGFLLLVSLIVSTALSFTGKFLGGYIPVPAEVLQVGNFIFSFSAITLLFGLIFKFVPAVKIRWRDVAVGAVGTALLFTGGKFLLGLYLGKSSVSSVYGAAGSVVALIIWVYYSAQIFFFGAEFTKVYADEHTRRTVKPEPERASETNVPKAFNASA